MQNLNEKSDDLFEVIPGYRAAVQEERAARDRAFIPDLTERICGIEVLPMTFGCLLKLSATESPFVGPGIPSPEAVLEFLWAVSPEYVASFNLRRSLSPWFPKTAVWIFNRAKKRFGRKLRLGKAFKEWVLAIRAYVKESFADGPRGSGGGVYVTYFSGVALTIKLMCDDLNCSQAELMAMPLKQFFQHQRRMELRGNPNAILWNESDGCRDAWLCEQFKPMTTEEKKKQCDEQRRN